MANGPGVSMAAVDGGKWRVRWREEVVEDGATRRVQREKVVSDEATAILLRAKILRAVETGEVFVTESRKIPTVATLDAVLAGFIRSERGRGIAPSSVLAYADRGNWGLAAFRAMAKIPEGQAVPGTMLTRGNLINLNLFLRDQGKGTGHVRNVLQVICRAWAFAAGDPATYPGIAMAPPETKSIVPRAKKYGSTVSPTMAECDAVIREVRPLRRGDCAFHLAVIARFTGLRTAQIKGLRPDDVNLADQTLTIRIGKSETEKAELRVVPLAPALMEYMIPLVTAARQERRVFLVPRRADAKAYTREVTGSGGVNATLKRAWERCTERGEVRKIVWAPENRENTRPDHAFRSAFLGCLKRAEVEREVRDALVGHAGDMADRHYAGAETLMDAMRRAVALIPPIDWKGSRPEKASNVLAFAG